jgi:hypothetical protein
MMKTATSDYLRGMEDCKAGNDHKPHQSEDYDRGYAAQYAHEQVLTEISLQQERINDIGRKIRENRK